MMLEIAERALQLASRERIKQAEAFVAKNIVTTIRIASSRIAEVKRVHDGGIGVRVAVGKKVGFASANELNPELVKRVISIARSRPPNPDFNGFPAPKEAKHPPKIYDRDLAALPGERPTELAEVMLRPALDSGRVADVSGALNVVVERCAVANTNGVSVSDRSTKIFGHLTVEAGNAERSEGVAWLGSTSSREFDPAAIGERATELAVSSLHAERIEPGNYDVILEPHGVAELFYHVLGYAVNGKEVHDKISYFTDRLGDEVAVEELSIHDWGNMLSGLCSKTIDDEGVPTQRTSLIERGRLLKFVHDRYYAGKIGKQSTGNGLRLGDIPGRCYSSEPSPHLTNLVVEPGDFKRDELIEDTSEGLLLSRIWYTYPITPQLGDFSTTSRCGFFIRRGKIAHAIKQVRIHENLPRLLKRITGIGEDVEQVMPWGASAAVHAPSLRFSKVRVST